MSLIAQMKAGSYKPSHLREEYQAPSDSPAPAGYA